MPTYQRDESSFPLWNNGGTETNLDTMGVSYSNSVYARGKELHDFYTVDDPYPKDRSFDSYKYKLSPWVRNGLEEKRFLWPRLFHNHTESNQRGLAYSNMKTLAGSPDWTYWKNAALHGANPNKPVTDVSVFLWELKEFPKMLKFFWNLGRRRPSLTDIPEADLMYQFGIRPFVSDLSTLLSVGEQINKRYYTLRRLLDQGSKRYSRTLGQYDLGPTVTSDTNSNPRSTTTIEGTTKVRAVFNVEYSGEIPFAPFKPPSGFLDFFESNSEALSSLYGFRSAGADSLWNMIPWTWLIDYFANIGNLLEERSRDGLDWNVPFLWVQATTVMQGEADMYYYGSYISKASLTNGKATLSIKRRRGYPQPQQTLHVEPFLTDRQLQNLASLSLVTAFRKGGGYGTFGN